METSFFGIYAYSNNDTKVYDLDCDLYAQTSFRDLLLSETYKRN